MKKTTITLPATLPRLPTKPKGGGFHKHRNTKRLRTRADQKRAALREW